MSEVLGNERALVGALDALRPQGIVVQIGLGGEFKISINTIVVKEIELRGAFRFYKEFELAAELIGKRLVDVRPLLTATLPFERAVEAFELAGDRARAMKVQLASRDMGAPEEYGTRSPRSMTAAQDRERTWRQTFSD